MRTTARAVPVSLVLVLVVLFAPAPAGAAAVYVETNPSTVRVGDEVGLRASCTDNLQPATVSATPFGTVTVRPNFGILTATTRVPDDTRPADYEVTLRCPDGQTATSMLHVLERVEPDRGPATGGGGTAPGRSTPMLIGGGLAAIAAGLVLAVVALRRRRFG
ncbi:MAG TPA: hypothetical protein VFH03_18245 [Actinoplanes sp.]|nr:hypothetical protein [Actinoplanes sp.]